MPMKLSLYHLATREKIFIIYITRHCLQETIQEYSHLVKWGSLWTHLPPATSAAWWLFLGAFWYRLPDTRRLRARLWLVSTTESPRSSTWGNNLCQKRSSGAEVSKRDKEYSRAVNEKRNCGAEVNKIMLHRKCDVSYNCNDPISQSECSVLTFMRNSALFIFLFVKIKAFWFMWKIWYFVLQRIEY